MLASALLLTDLAFSAPAPDRFRDAPKRGGPLGTLAIRIVRFPRWLLLLPLRPFIGAPEPVRGTLISRSEGWSKVSFPLREHGLEVFLALSGRAQIGRVEIVFEDGEMRQVDLEPTRVYGHGLYWITSFGGGRDVMLVRLEARARTPKAGMRILLARDAGAPVATLVDPGPLRSETRQVESP